MQSSDNNIQHFGKKKRVPFEDPDIKTVYSLIYGTQNVFEWRRPNEITKNPKFFIDGALRFDVKQGSTLGDCWLLSAMSSLTLNEELFNQVVLENHGFGENYDGQFKFRLWDNEKWVDIVIDDRLPYDKEKKELIYSKSSDKNEFWSALLEKAYAKLKGSYTKLHGGSTVKAMKAFTGREVNIFTLKNPPFYLFDEMRKAFEKKSLICADIYESDSTTEENRNNQGLIGRHSYSITNVRRVTKKDSSEINLIRIRNPWGDGTEWKGPWSDTYSEWEKISEIKSLNLKIDADGEFWISFSDFVKNFSAVYIC